LEASIAQLDRALVYGTNSQEIQPTENTSTYENSSVSICHRDAIGSEKCDSEGQNPALKSLAEMIKKLSDADRERLLVLLKQSRE